jgi:hypothetical protein
MGIDQVRIYLKRWNWDKDIVESYSGPDRRGYGKRVPDTM